MEMECVSDKCVNAIVSKDKLKDTLAAKLDIDAIDQKLDQKKTEKQLGIEIGIDISTVKRKKKNKTMLKTKKSDIEDGANFKQKNRNNFLYLPRCEGSRNLTQVKLTYKRTAIGLQ